MRRLFLLLPFLLLAACEPPQATSTSVRPDRTADAALRAYGRPMALASKVVNTCPDFKRDVDGVNEYIQRIMQQMARDGFSSSEISKAFQSVNAKRENAIDRSYLRGLGVNPDSQASMCAYGKRERRARTPVGNLLRRA